MVTRCAKCFIAAIFFGVALFDNSIVFAQATTTEVTSSTSSTIEIVEERNETIVDQVRIERDALIAQPTENTALLSFTERNRIRNLAANISNRHDATIQRLSQIADRLERAQERNSGSREATNARQALVVARQALSTAAATLSTIDTDVHSFVYSPDPQQDWKRVKAIYTLAGQSIIDAQTALRISLNELRNQEILQQ